MRVCFKKSLKGGDRLSHPTYVVSSRLQPTQTSETTVGFFPPVVRLHFGSQLESLKWPKRLKRGEKQEMKAN